MLWLPGKVLCDGAPYWSSPMWHPFISTQTLHRLNGGVPTLTDNRGQEHHLSNIIELQVQNPYECATWKILDSTQKTVKSKPPNIGRGSGGIRPQLLIWILLQMLSVILRFASEIWWQPLVNNHSERGETRKPHNCMFSFLFCNFLDIKFWICCFITQTCFLVCKRSGNTWEVWNYEQNVPRILVLHNKVNLIQIQMDAKYSFEQFLKYL